MDKKKVVLKLEAHDEKARTKALKTVSCLSGIESVAMEAKDRKLTVIGDVDPVAVVSKLRKLFHTEVVSIGPAKEPEKKKEEPKKEEPKKEDPKKAQEKQIEELVKAYKAYNPCLTQYYHVYSAEENPNACVIC